jgi:nucleosome binding factor SPN SPT16 subunit
MAGIDQSTIVKLVAGALVLLLVYQVYKSCRRGPYAYNAYEDGEGYMSSWDDEEEEMDEEDEMMDDEEDEVDDEEDVDEEYGEEDDEDGYVDDEEEDMDDEEEDEDME